MISGGDSSFIRQLTHPDFNEETLRALERTEQVAQGYAGLAGLEDSTFFHSYMSLHLPPTNAC